MEIVVEDGIFAKRINVMTERFLGGIFLNRKQRKVKLTQSKRDPVHHSAIFM